MKWDFDRGLSDDFSDRAHWVKDGTRADYKLPEWISDGGVNRSGALKFPAEGASLFLKTGVQVNKLPIHVEFDLWLLDATKLEIGIWEGRHGGTDRSKFILKFEKAKALTNWKTGAWMHASRMIEEKKGIVVTRTLYDGFQAGDYMEETKEPWSDEHDREYFEIYGKNFIIDNLAITVGEPVGAKKP